METKYDYIVNLLLDNWIVVIIVIVAIIIGTLPSIKEGLKMILMPFNSAEKKNNNFIIEYADEKVVCEIVSRSYDFDVVKIHATTHRLGIQAERKWIDKFYSNYTYNMQMLRKIQTGSCERFFDIIPITNGTITKDIYFDITDFFDGAPVPLTGNVSKYAEQKIKDIYNKNIK